MVITNFRQGQTVKSLVSSSKTLQKQEVKTSQIS
jgi:hypothetical protein